MIILILINYLTFLTINNHYEKSNGNTNGKLTNNSDQLIRKDQFFVNENERAFCIELTIKPLSLCYFLKLCNLSRELG